MADGGVAMGEIPSTPKMDWPHEDPTANRSMTMSLSDHLQRLFTVKDTTKQDEDDEGEAFPDDSTPIKKFLQERDEMWREHERSQIDFMEREHERMVKGLHDEINRLQTKCADLTRHLAETLTATDLLSRADSTSDEERKLLLELERTLQSTRNDLATMREVNERKEEKIRILELRCKEQESQYREELEQKNRQIEQINVDLNRKAAVVAQLTTQLHQLRLREAVEKQRYEQRRQMAEQQFKRRQALAAASKTDPPAHRVSEAAFNRSRLAPGNTATRFRSDQLRNNSSEQHARKAGGSLAAAAASSPSCARRTRSLALPSIMSPSAVRTPAANGQEDQPRKLGGNPTPRSRPSSITGKSQE